MGLEDLLLLKKNSEASLTVKQGDPVEGLHGYLTDLFPGSMCDILVEGTDFKFYTRVNRMPEGVIPFKIKLTLTGGKILEGLSINDEEFRVNQDGKVIDINDVEIGQRLTKIKG